MLNNSEVVTISLSAKTYSGGKANWTMILKSKEVEIFYFYCQASLT